MVNNNILSPSLYAANLLNLENELNFLEQNKVKNLHFDVMDGNFVEVISIGQLMLERILKNYNFKVDVHLMCNNNLNFIKSIDLSKIECLTIHIESLDFLESLNYLKTQNVKIGIALKPQTNIEEVKKYITEVDLILPMSVTPGKSGQQFIDITEKISKLRQWKFESDIQVDGGINDQTLKQCLFNGANNFVIGSYIFNNKKNLNEIKKFLFA